MKNSFWKWKMRIASVLAGTLCFGLQCHAQGWQHLGDVQSVERRGDGVEVLAGKAKVRITAFREGVFRVRVAPAGSFMKDFSWAVVQHAEPPAVTIKETPQAISIRAGSAVATINKSPLLVSFADSRGNVVLADEPSLPMAWNGSRMRVWKKMPLDELFFGLGDKAGPINRRNRAFSFWNSDDPGWGETTDPLYKTIPFFIGMHKGNAYGIFFDNTYRSSFDFGTESPEYYSFGSEDGELDYYYFAGPDPKSVVSSYTALVGRIPLPPLWAMGYQQSRWSYYPEARVREIADRLRQDKIPADAIYLDIDYQKGFAPFTVNREYFPHFEEMIHDLAAQHFHTVLITDLHIKYAPNTGYEAFDSGMKDDVFVKKADGSLYIAPVWPGDSVFPDFTLSRVRDWWGMQYQEFVKDGASGFWNDMNEPAVFVPPLRTMPLDNIHRLDDGTTLDHRAIHNIYGMLNSRSTYEGSLRLRSDERPFVLTRASYAGGARYSATWTGDNLPTWAHLAMSTSNLLSLGLSGFPLAGADIGGFGGSPEAYLLTRWVEVGAFNPLYRSHAMKGTSDHEPWANGPEHEAIRRKFVETRYRLMPYIYTEMEATSRTGIPLMRPVFLQYPQAESFYQNDRDFLLGEDLFVSPVVTDTLDAHTVQFPPGEWYDYWTTTKYSDKDRLELHPALDQLPLYVRAGAILPEQPIVQSTDEKPDGPLQLRVYPGKDCHGSLYEDDGHTFEYKNGKFLRINYSCEATKLDIRVSSHVVMNGFQPWWHGAELKILGLETKPNRIQREGGKDPEWSYDGQTKSAIIAVTDALRDWTIHILH